MGDIPDTEPPRDFMRIPEPTDLYYSAYKALLNGQRVVYRNSFKTPEDTWLSLDHPQIAGKAENIQKFGYNNLIIEPPQPKNLLEDIKHAINCRSAENGSNTPDFILGEYLQGCLELLDTTINEREKWYGRDKQGIDWPTCGDLTARELNGTDFRNINDITPTEVTEAMHKKLCVHLNDCMITSENIGSVRRSLFLPFDCEWNGVVRDETAARENNKSPHKFASW